MKANKIVVLSAALLAVTASILSSIELSARADETEAGALEDLFPKPLLSDDDKKKDKSIISGDSFFDSSIPAKAKPNAADSVAKAMQQLSDGQVDNTMRQQMEKVSSWLQEFSLRNHSNFPGVHSNFGSPQQASQVQLSELVGTNPYTDDSDSSTPARELNGLTPGLSASYRSDGNPVAASPVESDEWTSELQAQQNGRVNLAMDYSISQIAIEQWRNDPPGDWQAAPGTITGLGNNQGMFVVWGAGRDGLPLKDSSGKRVYILSGRSGATLQDQIAPNSGQ